MGCYTLYFVREPDGSAWTSTTKWGSFQPTNRAALHQIVTEARRSPRPGAWGGWLCRGLSVDRSDPQQTRVRWYACGEAGANAGAWIEKQNAAFAAELGPGFSVDYAWGRVHELAALAGEPCAPELTEAEGDPPALLGTAFPPALAHTWDAARRTLRYPRYELQGASTWISVIRPDGTVHDLGLSSWQALPRLFLLGPSALESLAAQVPQPLGIWPEPSHHAIFDQRRREVFLWSTEPCWQRPGWEGWAITRMGSSLDDHLARTGRRIDERGDLVPAEETRGLQGVQYLAEDPPEARPEAALPPRD